MRMKLILGFTGILIIFSAVALYNLGQVNQIKRQIAVQNSAMDKKVLALELVQHLNNVSSAATTMIGTQNLELIGQYNSFFDPFKDSVVLMGQKAATPEQRQWAKQLEELSKHFTGTVAEAVKMLQDESADPLVVIEKMDELKDAAKKDSDEIAKLADNFHSSYTREAIEAVSQSRGLLDSTVQASLVGVAAVIVVSIAVAWLLIRAFSKPIRRLQRALEAIAEGDLRHTINAGTKDELGQLSDSFDHMIDKVNDMLGNTQRIALTLAEYSSSFRQFSQTTASANAEIVHAIEAISAGADQQATRSERSAQLIYNLEQAVNEITSHTATMAATGMAAMHNTQSGAQSVESLKAAADRSDEMLRNVTAAMEALSSSSQQIDRMANTIAQVSHQTNILALNASIEAARAGSHGKGFGVIAEEVRLLSLETKDSSAFISQSVQSLSRQMKDVRHHLEQARISLDTQYERVDDTLDAFRSINRSIAEITSQVEQVALKAKTTQQQNESLSQSIQFVAGIAEETAASVQEVNSTSNAQDASIRRIAQQADDINDLSQKLFLEINRFQIRETEDQRSASEIVAEPLLA